MLNRYAQSCPPVATGRHRPAGRRKHDERTAAIRYKSLRLVRKVRITDVMRTFLDNFDYGGYNNEQIRVSYMYYF